MYFHRTGTLFVLLSALFLVGCSANKTEVDSIIYNAHIVDPSLSDSGITCIVIQNGKIMETGTDDLLKKYTCSDDRLTDAKGAFVYPGFIDAHCHFYGYATTLLNCNLTGTKSWTEVLEKVKNFADTQNTQWIQGRGWDQNDWAVKSFPNKHLLDSLFPVRPVVLKRIDGHAVICNTAALNAAGIDNETLVNGGEIVKENNQLTGVLIDNAVELVTAVIPEYDSAQIQKALKMAESECFSYGLTTLADAGLDLDKCMLLDDLQAQDKLDIFLYLMLNPGKEEFKYAVKTGIYETDNMRIGSFKLYADGALGSRGARLKQDYCDRPGHRGMLIKRAEYYDSVTHFLYQKTKYQVNTHCIGDSANSLVLDAYSKCLPQENDRRWRIEHAQIIDLQDMHKFGQYKIIPSVQPTHATSDGPWVNDRICENRMDGAYAYKSLLGENQYIALGTDFPVEYLQPIYTFYSAVFRQSFLNENLEAFLLGQALSPKEALLGMTAWAAKACHLEHRKGSIKAGMDADFVISNINLLNTQKDLVKMFKVLQTIRAGKTVYMAE